MRLLRPREVKITFPNQRAFLLELRLEPSVWPQGQAVSSLLPNHALANW